MFEVDILNDTRHVAYSNDQQGYSMKQQQVEPPKAFDPLAALELAAPPGTEYSDAIVAYQIGVFFRANPETLQKRLPGGWKVADQWGPGPRGKLLEGANVVMGFHETFLESEKAPSKNKPHGRFVTFAAMAHNPSTDERCNISFTGFNADPAKVPGKYKDKKLARSISRKLSVTGDDASTLVSESFDVDTGDGSIHFAVDYSRQQPLWLYATAVPPDAVVFRAAADPSGRRIYWEDTLNYIILSRPASIDVTSKLEFKIDVPGLRDVAAGSETVAVIVRPYLFRRVFSSK